MSAQNVYCYRIHGIYSKQCVQDTITEWFDNRQEICFQEGRPEICIMKVQVRTQLVFAFFLPLSFLMGQI